MVGERFIDNRRDELADSDFFLEAISERHFFIEPSLIDALFHLGTWGRIDAGFRFSFITRSPVTIGMRLPVRMAFQPVDVVYLGVSTGMGIYDFDIAKEAGLWPTEAVSPRGRSGSAALTSAISAVSSFGSRSRRR